MKNYAFADKQAPHTVKVYGQSDDLIEVEGSIREEFEGYDANFLHFGDGTILEVWFNNDGIWRIERTKEGSATCEIVKCALDDEELSSDVAMLTGDLDRVELWGGMDPDFDTIESFFLDHGWEGVPMETLLKIYRMVQESDR
jgi:hypothetical protein